MHSPQIRIGVNLSHIILKILIQLIYAENIDKQTEPLLDSAPLSASRIHESPDGPTETFAPAERYVYRTATKVNPCAPVFESRCPNSSGQELSGRTRNVYAQQ